IITGSLALIHDVSGDQATQILDRQEIVIGTTVISEARGYKLPAQPFRVTLTIERGAGDDYVLVSNIDCTETVRRRDHLFMQFFTRADTNNLAPTLRRNGLGQVGDAVAWNFRNNDFSAFCGLNGVEYDLHPFFQRDTETCHARVGD